MARTKQTKRAVGRPVRAVTKKAVSPPPKQQFESESESESDNESNYSDEELQNDEEEEQELEQEENELEKDFERLREKERLDRLDESQKEWDRVFESEREKQKKQKQKKKYATAARRVEWRMSPQSDSSVVGKRKLLRVPIRLCNSRPEFHSADAKRVGNTGPLQLCIIGIIRVHFPQREKLFPGDGDADFVICAYLPPDLVDALHVPNADVDAIFNEICRRIQNNEILRDQLWASPSKALAHSRGLSNFNGWTAYVWCPYNKEVHGKTLGQVYSNMGYAFENIFTDEQMETIFSEIPEDRRHHKNRSHPKKDTRIKFVSPSRSPPAIAASAASASDSEFECRSSSSSESIVESSLVRDAHEVIDLVSDEPEQPKVLPRPQQQQQEEQWLHRQPKEDEFEDDQEVDEIIVSLDPPKRQKRQLEAPGAPKKPKKTAFTSFVGRVQNGIAAATDALIEQIGIMNDRVMEEAKNLAREAAARRDEAEARAHEAKNRQDALQKCSQTIVAGLREFDRLTK